MTQQPTPAFTFIDLLTDACGNVIKINVLHTDGTIGTLPPDTDLSTLGFPNPAFSVWQIIDDDEA